MNSNFPRRKRILSKGQYVFHLGKKVTLAPFGCLLCLLGGLGLLIALCMAITVVSGWLSLLFSQNSIDLGILVTGFVVMGLTGSLSLASLWTGLKAIEAVTEMEPVAPLTRHTAEQLPEPESLVRASSEPAIEQSDVLLRAAHPGQETPAEELLRAHENGTGR
jgi:hypothetical protein